MASHTDVAYMALCSYGFAVAQLLLINLLSALCQSVIFPEF